uniref:Uncharacterized protein n=1 Tax=Astatotilapia calliptera TaxID=8154 RepID=A0AAX7W780_ASTCA
MLANYTSGMHQKIGMTVATECHKIVCKPGWFCRQMLWIDGVKSELFGHNQQKICQKDKNIMLWGCEIEGRRDSTKSE